MPKVSIIMPVYNKEKYLEKTLDSVLAQSFQDYELIVINDGSTDSSGAIAEEYASRDKRIRVLSVPNGGVSQARNIGMQAASGAWIQFLDGDDTILPHYLSDAYEFGETQKADIVFSGFVMTDPSGKVLSEKNVAVNDLVNQEQLCDLFIQYQYKNGFFGYISNKLFKRDLLEKTKAVFPCGVTLAEDLDFYVHLYCGIERAAFWQGNSFCYLQTDENYLLNANINYHHQLQIQKNIRKWFMQSGMHQKYHEILEGKIADYIYYILFNASEHGENIHRICEELMSQPLHLECAKQYRHSNDKFEKVVLLAFSKKKSIWVERLFSTRNFLRKIYRKCR